MIFYSHEKKRNIYAAMRSYPVRFRFGKIP